MELDFSFLHPAYLRQRKPILQFTLLTSVAMFVALSTFSGAHRYQLALYLSFILYFTASVVELAILVTASGMTVKKFEETSFFYCILCYPTLLQLLLASGTFCWMLWELAFFYQHRNPLFSEYLALIPIGILLLTLIWYFSSGYLGRLCRPSLT